MLAVELDEEDTFPVGVAELPVSKVELLEPLLVDDGGGEAEGTAGVVLAAAAPGPEPKPDEDDPDPDPDPPTSSGVSVLVSGANVG